MDTSEQNTERHPDDFYSSLSEKLMDAHDFPEDYLYKFIIPNDQSKLTEIYRAFDGTKYTLSSRESKNGNYMSCSVSAFVMDAEQVIDIYREVGKIVGVIML